MSTASYVKKVKVSVDEADWKEVPCTSPSMDLSGDVLDDTTLANNAGWRSRILGLHDWSVSCDSNYTAGNDALTLIRAAKINRSKLYVQYLPDGTTANGFQGEVVVENFNLSGETAGLETVGITLQANGAIKAAA